MALTRRQFLNGVSALAALNGASKISALVDQVASPAAPLPWPRALGSPVTESLRPTERQVIIPQIDARLWTHYHTTNWPHHMTRTIMY